MLTTDELRNRLEDIGNMEDYSRAAYSGLAYDAIEALEKRDQRIEDLQNEAAGWEKLSQKYYEEIDKLGSERERLIALLKDLGVGDDLEQRYKEAIETLEDCEMWFVELQGTDYNEDGAVTDQRDSIRAVIAKARGKE